MQSMLVNGRGKHFFSAFYEYVLESSQPRAHLINSLPKHSSLYQCNASKLYTTSSSSPKESLKPQTHYEIFRNTVPSGPPPNGPFMIDVTQLRNEFLQLQAKAHPDLHQGENRARAEGASALINEAYKTLQNPLRRAQYLLSLRGMDVAEDETAKVDDPDLLMDVLEMRENIEDAEEESDLAPMKEANDAKIGESVRVLEVAFKEDDMETAKGEAVKLRYWMNIKESLEAWEKGKPVVLVH